MRSCPFSIVLAQLTVMALDWLAISDTGMTDISLCNESAVELRPEIEKAVEYR